MSNWIIILFHIRYRASRLHPSVTRLYLSLTPYSHMFFFEAGTLWGPLIFGNTLKGTVQTLQHKIPALGTLWAGRDDYTLWFHTRTSNIPSNLSWVISTWHSTDEWPFDGIYKNMKTITTSSDSQTTWPIHAAETPPAQEATTNYTLQRKSWSNDCS